MTSFYYKPNDGWPADFIPFYDNGRFYLYYLKDWRNPEQYGEGTPWYLISTIDFVNYEDHGEVIPRGSKEEQDLYIFTGCILKANGIFHIYYTGHNPHYREQGKPEQAVMHAISSDLMNWQKIYEDTFYAPIDQYEQHDWRDPFVFWNEETEEYWMLLAARTKGCLPTFDEHIQYLHLHQGNSQEKGGCTALCVSKDLKNWVIKEPFWKPNLFFTHECPDLFKIGDWWYLIYSTFCERVVTHYSMSRSLEGPWLIPSDDAFDGRAFYAAKSWSDGNNKRFLFGWNPTKSNHQDDGAWNWGGNLIVHEIIQRIDGTLCVKIPTTVDHAFTENIPLKLSPFIGNCAITNTRVTFDGVDEFSSVIAGQLPNLCNIKLNIEFDEHTRSCGIYLGGSHDHAQSYRICLDILNNTLVLDSDYKFWDHTEVNDPSRVYKPWEYRWDYAPSNELFRPIELIAGEIYEFNIIIDDTLCEIYLNQQVVLSARLYHLPHSIWGIFATEGKVIFDKIKLSGFQNNLIKSSHIENAD